MNCGDEKVKSYTASASLPAARDESSFENVSGPRRLSRAERNKVRCSRLDPSVRPGAYSEAPGQQGLHRNGTIPYERVYHPSPSERTTNVDISKSSNASTTTTPYPTLASSSNTPNQDRSNYYLRESLARRKMVVNMVVKEGDAPSEPSESIEPQTNTNVDIEAADSAPTASCEPRILNHHPSSASLFQQQDSNSLLDPSERYQLDDSSSRTFQNYSTSSLPVAAEIAKTEGELEGEIRARLACELVESCSLAEPVTQDSKGKRVLSCVLCSMVLIIVVVWVCFAVRILQGDYLGTSSPTNNPVSRPSNSSTTNTNNDVAPQLVDSTVLTQVPATICHDPTPMMGASILCPPQPLGSAVGNLVAASRLQSVPQASISILHAGELQGDIASGTLELGRTKSILKNYTLVTLSLQGYQLVTVLERALEKLSNDVQLQQAFGDGMIGHTGSSYPYGAGIRFDVNLSQPFPHRLSQIQVYNNTTITTTQWEPLVWRGVDYTIVTSSYLANGGDGYHEFSQVESHDTGLNSLTEFIAYCQRQETLLAPSLNDYSTQSFTP